MQFNEFKQNVLNWSKERKIIPHSTSAAQMGKTLEEVAETWQAIVKGDTAGIKDGIGDIAVTIVNVDALLYDESEWHNSYLDDELCLIDGYDWEEEMRLLISQLSKYKIDTLMLKKAMESLYSLATSPDINVDFYECLDLAWNEIKDRKGIMGEDGVFYKDAGNV